MFNIEDMLNFLLCDLQLQSKISEDQNSPNKIAETAQKRITIGETCFS